MHAALIAGKDYIKIQSNQYWRLNARVEAQPESLLWNFGTYTLLFNHWNFFNYFHILLCNPDGGKFAKVKLLFIIAVCSWKLQAQVSVSWIQNTSMATNCLAVSFVQLRTLGFKLLLSVWILFSLGIFSWCNLCLDSVLFCLSLTGYHIWLVSWSGSSCTRLWPVYQVTNWKYWKIKSSASAVVHWKNYSGLFSHTSGEEKHESRNSLHSLSVSWMNN